MEQEARIKQAILNTEFSPVAEQGVEVAAAYPPGTLVGKLPQRFDDMQLLKMMDKYTSGDTGTIVQSAGASSDSQYVYISPETLQELKANLRSGTQIKFPGTPKTAPTR
jgi:hypothetical protein